MLRDRITKIKYRSPKSYTHSKTVVGKSDIRQRSAKLLDIEGWYTVEDVPSRALALYKEYKRLGLTLKFTRWLARTGHSQEFISGVGKDMAKVDVKISCRHADLVRLGETDHYKSCLAETYAAQQLMYLADPDVAVVFTTDASGKFVWRSILRLVHCTDGALALVHYRVYGNGPTESIFSHLSRKLGMRIYKALDIKTQLPATEVVDLPKLHSPTVHNNPWLKQPIWTDHNIGFSKSNRLWIRAHRDPYQFDKEYQCRPNKENQP